MSIATAVVNGVHLAAQDPLDEVAEFEKILKLRDEIFAGNHPRLTVPAHVLRKVSPVSTQSSSRTPVSVPAQQQVPQVSGLHIALAQDGEKSKQNLLPGPSPPQPTPSQPAVAVSSINPVLLTKSAEVVKAEITLLRNRLERQLRDQFEQKRADFRKRPAPAEAKPDFDIVTVLMRALEIVKPVSLSKESDKEDDNESFDENSLYSSRAPDSTPDRPDQSPSSQDGEIQENVPADGTKEIAIPGSRFPQADHPPSIRDAVPQLSVSNPTPSELVPKPPNDNGGAMDVDDEDEEGEYSPPEAVDQSPAQNGNSSQMIPDPRSRHLRKYSDLDQHGKRPASPSDNVRIVRNHITSPIAPQPSRVSPLTLTKDSLVSQDRRYQENRHRGRANSPSQSPETVGQRNRKRKLNRKEEKRLKKIKREDISPPPFHDIQPLGQNKLAPPDQEPIVVDDLPPPPPPPLPPQEIRYVQASPAPPPAIRYVEEAPYAQEIRYMPASRYVEVPPRPLSRQGEGMPMSEPRVLSRASMRPREDADLRRVASMHNMRAEQPREYVEADTPSRQRAVSYMRVESPMREVAREYITEGERSMHEVRLVRTPAAEYREVYSPAQGEVRYIQDPMPPPPPHPRERIVVDQYGRRFREIIAEASPAVPRAASYAPREMARYTDTYGSTRAGSILTEERAGPRYEPEMPPPSMMMRPLAEPATKTPTAGGREVYEPLPSGRAGSLPVYDGVSNSRPGTAQVYERARASVYADGAGDIRTPIRMSSVRPASQYDEVMQVLPRAGSVRPPARDGGARLEDRGPGRREYVPVEQSVQPRYRVVEPDIAMAPPPTRYVDAHGREVIAAGQQDGEVRYVQRY